MNICLAVQRLVLWYQLSLTLEKNSDKYPLSLQDALGEEI